MFNIRQLVFLFIVTTGIHGERYLVALLDTGNVRCVTGEEDGWFQIDSNPRQNMAAFTFKPTTVFQSISVASGIAENSVVVETFKVRVQVAIGYGHSSLLPISALGTKYIVSSCHQESPYTSALVIASHSAQTNVEITFNLQGTVTYDDRVYKDGDTLRLTLQPYQTFTLKSNFDLSGTVVSSSQTVAVFSGTLTMNDLVSAYEQLLPVRHFGQEFVLAVADYRGQYELQVVSESSSVQISFNNGSTAVTDAQGLYKQVLTSNSSLHFTTDRPVMATVCRKYFNLGGLVVVPPVSLYATQTSLYISVNKKNVKILTQKTASDTVFKVNSTTSLPIEWEEIPGSSYKVGTLVDPGNHFPALFTSSNKFAVLVSNSGWLFNGGYDFQQPSVDQITTPAVDSGSDGERYLVALLDTGNVRCVTGEEDGWFQIDSNPRQNMAAFTFKPTTVFQSISVASGIAENSVVVETFKVKVQVAIGYGHSSLLPISALGTKYIVSSCHQESPYTSALVIASHSAQTNVEITFNLQGTVSYDDMVYKDGDTLRLTLQPYQTFTLKSNFDLSGTVVSSSQTVAVFSGTLTMNDLVSAYEQLLPVRHFGQEFVLAVADYRGQYELQVVSESSSVQISFNNGSTAVTDAQGLYKQVLTSNSSLHFTTDRPVMATVCRKYFNLGGLVVVPPVSLYASQTSLYISVNKKNVKILTQKTASDTLFKVNSTTSLPIEWEEIPGSTYKVGTLVDPGNHFPALFTSSNKFAVLVSNSGWLFNGGYDFQQPSVDQTTTPTIDSGSVGAQASVAIIAVLLWSVLLAV